MLSFLNSKGIEARTGFYSAQEMKIYKSFMNKKIDYSNPQKISSTIITLPSSASLNNQEIDIEYVSPMALAQKGQELQSLMRGLELFGQIGQIAPVQDYIDENGLIKQIIRITGLPARMIKSDKQVAALREQRAAAQAQAMQMQQAMQEAQIAKDAAPMVKELNRGPTE